MSNETTTYLKYANLQIAAEAFYGKKTAQSGETYSGPLTVAYLTGGNDRTSRFTEVQAQAFIDEGWTVVEHKSNTATGFSGTLFRNSQTGELVLSFRSTEFADDAARDNQATNVMEIKAEGWAFGQIADMREWVDSLYADGKIDAPVTVTGYSLGGHLATAFNLLYPGAVEATYTFNGAGVGTVAEGMSVTQAMNVFSDHRGLGSNADLFTDADVLARYDSLKTTFKEGASITLAQVDAALDGLDLLILGEQLAGKAEAVKLYDAMQRVRSVVYEAERVNTGISSGTGSDSALPVSTAHIAAVALDYQLAVLRAGENTAGYRTDPVSGGIDAYAGRNLAPGGAIANFFDLYGAAPPSAVANSQLHYGTGVPIFIEDQPLYRGTVIADAGNASWKAGEAKLLVENFGLNDFGDTHSLVLIVDSLNVQGAFAQLAPLLTVGEMSTILSAAANNKAEQASNTQGKADGNTLESLVNALADVLGLNWGEGTRLEGSLEGNSWANVEDEGGFNGRATFHARLKEVTDSSAFQALVGKTSITAATGGLQVQAKTDFGAFLALQTLSPFVISTGDESALSALKSAHDDLATDWQADRNARLYGDTGYDYVFTEQWYEDRLNLLEQVIKVNRADASSLNPVLPAIAGGISGLVLQDFETERLLKLGIQTDEQSSWIVFGSQDDDPISGKDRGDHLYGGAGADTLRGLGGDDHLQGDAGDDVLEGGEGSDTLLGGVGSDTLDGGAGSDWLRGGAGADTYRFAAGWGVDIVEDSDGAGSLQVQGIGTLTGADAQLLYEGAWQTQDGRVRYARVAGQAGRDDLYIRFADRADVIIVRDWSEARSLGIALPGPQEQPQELPVLQGDIAKRVEGDHYVTNASGYAADGAEDGAADILLGGAGDERILGLGGNDGLLGGGGGDRLEGGEGDDLILGGAGADVVQGGQGNDLIYGSAVGQIERPVRVGFVMPALGAGQQEVSRGFSWVAGRSSEARLDGDVANMRFVEVAGAVLVPDAEDEGNLIDAGEGDDYVAAGSGDDVVHGGAGDDDLVGMGGSDVLFGDDGADFLWGDGSASSQGAYTQPEAHGDDVLSGGAGDDVLVGQGGADRLSGGTGNDWLWGDDTDAQDTPEAVHGNDYLDGGDGDDRLQGDGGDDILLGGQGNDRLWGDNSRADEISVQAMGRDWLEGGDGDDQLHGGGNGDVLAGGEGDDLLWGDDGQDVTPLEAHGNDDLDGGRGNDQLVGGGGDDVLRGGEGNDILYGDDEEANVAASAHGADYLDGGAGDDELVGGGGDDVLLGGAGSDRLQGGDGNDVLAGGAGTDLLLGGAGDDTYVFDAGDSSLNAQGEAELVDDSEGSNLIRLQGASASTLEVIADAQGNLILRPSASDWIGVRNGAALSGNRYELGDGTAYSYNQLVGRFATGTSAQAVDGSGGRHLLGGRDDNTLEASTGRTTFSGGRGNDVTRGAGGNNTYLYEVGDGSDTLIDSSDRTAGGAGVRLVFGEGIGPADISVSFSGEDVVLSFAGRAGDAIAIRTLDLGDQGRVVPIDEFVFGGGVSLTYEQLIGQRFVGSAGDDLIEGSAANETLLGHAGNDTLLGLAGNDTLQGGSGDDRLEGGAGADVLLGGDDYDLLHGGAGHDRIAGGRGGDTIVLDGTGAEDGDVLEFAAGDGHDVVQAGGSSGNVIRFAPGIDPSALQVVRLGGSSAADAHLLIRYGEGDQIEIGAGAAAQIDGLDFAGGASLSMQSLLASVLPTGTPGNDVLSGSLGPDVLRGGDGDDILDGHGGGDLLEGGAGRDLLVGGRGDNVYVFASGSGYDVVRPTEGETATLRFDGMAAGALYASLDGSDLLITTVHGDQVRIEGFGSAASPAANWQVQTQEGAVSLQDLVAAAPPPPALSLAERRTMFLEQQYLELRTQSQYFPSTWENWVNGASGSAVPSAVLRADHQMTAGQDFAHPSYLDYERETTVTTVVQSTPIYSEEAAPTQTISGQYVSLQNLAADPGQPYASLPGGAVPVYGQHPAGSGGSSQGSWGLTGWFIQDETAPSSSPAPRRVIGWQSQEFEQTLTTTADVATQLLVQGTSAGDYVHAESSSNGESVLFRGVIETGDGSDAIYLNSGRPGPQSSSIDPNMDWGSLRPGTEYVFQNAAFQPRGWGAWIDAGAGNDVVLGSDASDIIIGGAGDDWLAGQSGADRYLISAADGGVDRIADRAAFDWGDPNTPEGFAFQVYGGDLDNPNRDVVEFDASVTLDRLAYRWNVPEGGDYKTLELFLAGRYFLSIEYRKQEAPSDREVSLPGIERFEFANGDALTLAQLLSLIEPSSSHVPEAVEPLVDQSLTQGLPWVFTIPSGAFRDDDPGDTLQYRLEAADGGGLPSWLQFDPLAGTLSGTPGADDTGPMALRVTAVDSAGNRAEQWLQLEVLPSPSGQMLVGTEGDDTLSGTAGADTLDGRAGNDALYGGLGNDTYHWGRGQGSDTIGEAGGVDTVVLSGLNPADVLVSRNPVTGTLMLVDRQTAQALSLTYASAPGDSQQSGIESVQFADGSHWNAAQLLAQAQDNAQVIVGTSGDDFLQGDVGNDVLDGGLGDDQLWGNGGDDTYVYRRGDGNDSLIEIGGDGTDTLQLADLNASDIRVLAGSGYGDDRIVDTATGQSIRLNLGLVPSSWTSLGWTVEQVQFADGTVWGAQQLQAAADADETLVGTSGADLLEGGGGDDVLHGGAGDDMLLGGADNDTYLYRSGDGNDTIQDTGGNDILHLLDLNPLDVTLSKDPISHHLQLWVSATGERITVQGGLDPNGAEAQLEAVQFADGTLWTQADMQAATADTSPDQHLVGTSGDDFLQGDVGNDVLDGGLGDDQLWGSSGNDTYVYRRGDGNDSLIEIGGDGTDTLQLVDLNASDIRVLAGSGYGDDRIVDTATGQSIRLNLGLVPSSWTSLGWTVEQVQFADGTVWGVSELQAAADADETLVGTAGADLLEGGGGNDALDGGAGDDMLLGGADNDTYLYRSGDGNDTMQDTGGNDILRLLDLNPSDVTLSKDPIAHHLQLQVNATGERITVQGGLDPDNVELQLESVQFADGTVWTQADMQSATANASPDQHLVGTSGDDFLQGDVGNDVLDGGLGDDQLWGNGGDDTYVYRRGDGNDSLIETGGDGTDTLQLADLNASDIRVLAGSGYGDDRIVDTATGQSIRLNLGLVPSSWTSLGWTVEQVQFADGTVWGAQQLQAAADADETLVGTSGADLLEGGGGDDVLDGMAGSDMLRGGQGNDTYLLGPGAEHDRIDQEGSGLDDLDVLRVTGGATPEQVWLRQVGSSLEVSVIGTDDRMSIDNWYLNEACRVDQIRVGGGQALHAGQVQALVQAMAAFAPPAPGQTMLPTDYQSTLSPVIAANWH